MTSPRRATVVGAGLAGTLMATLLARDGWRVTLLERRRDPRTDAAEAGRSINLAISTRGLAALEAVGLRERIEAISTLLHGRQVHAADSATVYQPYGKAGQGIRSVTRTDLSIMLLEAAVEAGVEIRFDVRCEEIDLAAGTVHLGGDIPPVTGDLLVGADGAFSAVRSQMQRLDRFNLSQQYLSHGYKELRIAPGPEGRHRLAPDVMHIWPRGGFMLMAMSNRDGSFTVTLYLPFRSLISFASLHTGEDAVAFFRQEFPDVVPLIPDLARQWTSHPTGSLVTVRADPWSVGDRVVLVGDACHAVVPFYGQGANAAFEDCLVLGEALRRFPADYGAAFHEYEHARRLHTDALAELAIENFLEMRDRVASPFFRARKGLERKLHRLFPRAFLPLYTMVSFTRIPYADARQRAQRQWWTVTGLAVLLALLVLAWVVQ